jgi:GTP-binding protein HflX
VGLGLRQLPRDQPVNERKIQTTEQARSEAILFGLVPHGDHRTAPEALAELSLLADTGNFDTAGCVVQHRRSPDPNTYLGRGKLEELAELVQASGSRFVIANESLSPVQGRNIEQALGCTVLDRSELILHIFETHARTPQAKLQVELARLTYQLPRLKRMWTHLERQRGGIGLRGGAGEKQIDLDKSEIRARIAHLGRQLQKIEARGIRHVRKRADHFTIALVGYTNAGKSTLMNKLTEAGVLAENRLFSTLDTRTRPWRLPGGRTLLLSDTVGFIRNLPHQLVASFHATLEEALNADLLFVVMDGSAPEMMAQLQVVEDVLADLDADEIPRMHIVNKIDQVEDQSLLAPALMYDRRAVPVSAKTGEGLDVLMARLQDHLAHREQVVQILVPHTAGALHSEIRSSATVRSEFYTEEGCLMEVQVSPQMLGRLLSRGAVLAEV